MYYLFPFSQTTFFLFAYLTRRHSEGGIEMEASLANTTLSVLTVIAVIWVWKVLNWLWLAPKRLERKLREQGLQGNSYRILFGDTKEMFLRRKDSQSKPMNLLDDLVPRVFPFVHQTVNNYGKNSFIWFGPTPRIIITNPEQIKDVLNKIYDFPKPHTNPLFKLLATGLASYEGEKWAKRRKIINPAFHAEKLKIMLPKLFQSCNDMISKWEKMLSLEGSCDVDVWPSIQTMTCDVISRTAFGSNYEEGMRIFELLKEQANLLSRLEYKAFIPGYRFLPTGPLRRMKENHKDIAASLKAIINKGEKALNAGEANMDNNLLGILLESNQNEIQDLGNNINVGMSIQDVIEECKLFYFAGQETTSTLLVWTMVLLSRYTDWQARAREEVFQVFGNQNPDFDGLSRLKIVNMILHEVLRLYPPGLALVRTADKDIKLGNLIIPAGVQMLLSILLVHYDQELWGDDAKEFNPERFSEGVSKATNGHVSFFPFGWGPRICIGQNFALLEAKVALSMILQHFSFELSPAYTHAPTTIFILQPQYGANLILHKL